MYRGRWVGGGGPILEFSPPPPMVNGGLEGQAGKEYVSPEVALPCHLLGWAVPRGGELPGAARGRFLGRGGLRASPIKKNVGRRPAWEAGCTSHVVEGAGVPALFLGLDGSACGPRKVLHCGAAQCSAPWVRGWGLKWSRGEEGSPARSGGAGAGENATHNIVQGLRPNLHACPVLRREWASHIINPIQFSVLL